MGCAFAPEIVDGSIRRMTRSVARLLLTGLWLIAAHAAQAAPASPLGPAWPRHTIDDRFDGPDGTKLADINRDGLQDVVTGWEDEGLTVVYLNPGQRFVHRSWPSVVIGATPAAEDAVFVDLDRNGVLASFCPIPMV